MTSPTSHRNEEVYVCVCNYGPWCVYVHRSCTLSSAQCFYVELKNVTVQSTNIVYFADVQTTSIPGGYIFCSMVSVYVTDTTIVLEARCRTLLIARQACISGIVIG